MIYIANGLSPKMLRQKYKQGSLHWTRLNKNQFKKETKQHMKQGETIINCIGHNKLAETLGIPYKRITIILEPGDTLYTIQDRDNRKGTMIHKQQLRLNIIRYKIE